MYKLIIVDDEPLVQVGIKSMLDYNSIDIEVCGIASNGKTALEIIERERPRIVVTDIKMPIMSGLELAQECQKLYGDSSPIFIVLTSYEDFSLAREAMHAGVMDYLIKLELTPELLQDTLKKAIASIKEKSSVQAPISSEDGGTSVLESYHDKFFVNLLHNLFSDREQFELQARELSLSFTSPYFVCSYIEMVGAELSPAMDDSGNVNLYHSACQMSQSLFDKYLRCYLAPLDLRHYAVVTALDSSTPEAFAKIASAIESVSDSLRSYYSVSLMSGTGTIVSDPLAIAESFQYARDAFSTATAALPHASFDDSALRERDKSFNFSIFKDSLSRAFEEFDSTLLDDTLSDIVELFSAHPSHYLQAMDCASNILYMAISLVPGGEEVVSAIFSESPEGYRSLYKLNNMDQVINWLGHFSAGLSDYFTEHRRDTRKPIVTNIKRYIKDNITEHLSLNEVAAVFGISPNYLSQLFAKYSDCGYNEYVTNCKIDEARRLLSSGEYKVYEVADMLGFENAFYFSKVFKKVVGIPPTTFMTKE